MMPTADERRAAEIAARDQRFAPRPPGPPQVTTIRIGTWPDGWPRFAVVPPAPPGALEEAERLAALWWARDQMAAKRRAG